MDLPEIPSSDSIFRSLSPFERFVVASDDCNLLSGGDIVAWLQVRLFFKPEMFSQGTPRRHQDKSSAHESLRTGPVYDPQGGIEKPMWGDPDYPGLDLPFLQLNKSYPPTWVIESCLLRLIDSASG